MNNEWLYQVRIKLPQDLADDLRSESNLDISKKINKIARKHQTRPVCTLDGFLDYVKEAEKNDIKDYPLYHWTKSVVQDPDKQIKHSKSFAFYFGDEQIYEKELAVSLYNDLVEFNDENIIEEIKVNLDKSFGNNYDFRRVEKVGPKVSAELLKSGVIAISLSLAIMLIYIWVRFEWQFSLGAILALFHDVIVTLGVFSLFSLEINLSIIAAVLTCLLYTSDAADE